MIAIFVEPTGSILHSVVESKALVSSVFPGCPYLHHPPHSTILFGNFQQSNELLQRVASAASLVAPFHIKVDGWHVFPNDMLAGGGDTVVLKVPLLPALSGLQLSLAEALSSFLLPAVSVHPLSGVEPFASSLNKYGFPFVGPHWMPHFSIASLPRTGAEQLKGALMREHTVNSMLVERVSVWSVMGDVHQKLVDCPLKFS